jgi:SPP1 gp7 family putative phage head morphogenesis protein
MPAKTAIKAAADAVLPDKLRLIASKEALAWVKHVSDIQIGTNALERAAELATEEFKLSAYVARLLVADKASSLMKAVSDAVSTGEIPKAFDRGGALIGKIITTGLDQEDPRIAFQASLRSAYSAGRYQRAMESIDEEPYFIYRSMRDDRVRASHVVLNGIALPKADPFWNLRYPPNGWRCRCKAYSIDEAGLGKLERAGVQVVREAPEEAMLNYINKTTGEKQTLPASVEPGWGFIPGSADGAEQMVKLLQRRMDALQTI